MISKKIATGCVAASLALTPASPVLADGDAIVGGIIGGIIGGAIVNESNKKRAQPQRTTTSTKRTYSKPRVSSAQRAENREIQVALNYFGYPVGSPDGAIGPKSRAAISQYQATLGYPATGQLTQFEKELLVSSYHRAVAGGSLTAQQAAANPMGVRGLLLGWRDERAGVAPQGELATLPTTTEPTTLPVIEQQPETGLPSFLGGDTMQASLASHCNKVSLMTSTNGGFTTAASMTDPMLALNEQFCLARTYAIAQGEDMAARIQGFTPAQIAEQCAGFGPAMKEHVAAISLKPADAVLSDVQGFAIGTGMAPAQLVGTAKICLSVGYRTDNMDVAIGSALLLATLGEGVYGEMMGHHLAQGIGAAQRPDLALGWFELSLDALEQGGTAIVAPGQPERSDLIRKAAFTIGGKADQLEQQRAVPAALPSFEMVPLDPEQDAPGVLTRTPAPPAQSNTVMASDEAAPEDGKNLGALPMAARLPYLLFRN